MDKDEKKTISAQISMEVVDLGDNEEEKKTKRQFKRIRIYALIALAFFIATAICLRTGNHDLGSYCVMGMIISLVLIFGVVGKLLAKASDGYTPWWFGGL